MPRVQEELVKFFAETDVGGRKPRELGKVGEYKAVADLTKFLQCISQFYKFYQFQSLNTDEAAAMGAVFKAAELSAGFKVRDLKIT